MSFTESEGCKVNLIRSNSSLYYCCWPVIFIFLGFFADAQDTSTREDTRNYDFFEALKYADARIWDKAIFHAEKVQSPSALKLINWLRLRSSDGNFYEFSQFLKENSHWPGLELLRTKGESLLVGNVKPKEVLDYFKGVFPKTGRGSLTLAKSLLLNGQQNAAETIVLVSWLTQTFNDSDFAEMRTRFVSVINNSNSERLNNMLWLELKDSVSQMLPFVSKEDQQMADVRLAIQSGSKNASYNLSKLSRAQINNAGLNFDRLNYKRKKGFYDSSEELLLSRSTSIDKLGKPFKWVRARQIYARRALRLGRVQNAYDIASSHFLSLENSFSDHKRVTKAYVDLEWLSGFIALEFLNKPKTAKNHFKASLSKSEGPNSISKGHYWLGRSYEKLAENEKAYQSYAVSSVYQESFYGQLSAERIGANPENINEFIKIKAKCSSKFFENEEIFVVGRLLFYSERSVLASRFFKHMAEKLSLNLKWCLAFSTENMGLKLASIGIAKSAIGLDRSFYRFSFPLHHKHGSEKSFHSPLVLAIIRQESEFYTGAISSTGAMGLMQIMPDTAKEVAKEIGLKYNRRNLLVDGDYNIKIGTAYITKMLKQFKGSEILAIAAYNAGPSRIKKWIKQFGDPRKKGVDPLVWIEMIPFMETKNYVIKVLASQKIYNALLSESDLLLDRGRKNFGHSF